MIQVWHYYVSGRLCCADPVSKLPDGGCCGLLVRGPMFSHMRPRFLNTMETVSLELQVESVERSIAFLRKEQMTLLRDLHLEVLSLQKRCAEVAEETELNRCCQQAEARLWEQECYHRELGKELSHKGALVGALRASLKNKERHFLEELKRRSHKITVLNTELQKQSEAAAYLSFQLHAARQKLHQQHHQHPPSRVSDRRLVPGPSLVTSINLKPKKRTYQPPSCMLTASERRLERIRDCIPREKVMGPEEPAPMPDPSLFLHPRDRQRPHVLTREDSRCRQTSTANGGIMNMVEIKNNGVMEEAGFNGQGAKEEETFQGNPSRAAPAEREQ
ncbi:coiled-coil domain-containing protein 92 isoform X2 [Erpetoichthys calabaricus]|uniref:coiled-coil domain-containing protein 92 isoform X2 n=1 Tax=Erpetoichthys calabaricus TaxID=27687 RepID=UPI002233EC6A|nr:coiled-coil domain-containing protein 92 isoform X2 [Erpetoichthys calabaricus]